MVGGLRARSTGASPRPPPAQAAPGATVWVHDYQLQLVPRHAPRAAPGPADRLLQPHPVPRLRDLRPAALAPADRRRPARRRPARLPAPERRHQLPAGLPPGGRADHPRRADPGARPARAAQNRAAVRAAPPSRSRSTLRPRFEELAGAATDVQARAGEIRASALGDPEPGAARRRPARLHQGDPAPAARPTARCLDEGLLDRARGGAGAGGQPEPGAGRAVPAAARRGRGHRRADQRQVRRAGQPAGALPAPVLPARGDGRAVPGRRRHAGDRRCGTA